MDTATPTREPLLGVHRDGTVRWCTPRGVELGLHGHGAAPARNHHLREWITQRAVAGTPGPVAALRGPDGRPWIVGFEATDDLLVLHGARWPTPGEIDLTAALVAAIGFQVSHTLRSPLAQLSGHHTLAQRGLDGGDIDTVRQELTASTSVIERLLADADETADCVRRLLPSDTGDDRAWTHPSAFAAAVDAHLADLVAPEVTTRFVLAGTDRLTATIDVPEPIADLAVGVATVAAYLRAAWAVDELVLRVGGWALRSLPGAAASTARITTLPPDGLTEQAFTIGRSIAQHAAVRPLAFASELGTLLAATVRISLLVPVEPATGPRSNAPDPTPDALLAALSRSGEPVLV